MANNHIWEQWQEGDFITSEALNEIERRITSLDTDAVNINDQLTQLSSNLDAIDAATQNINTLAQNARTDAINAAETAVQQQIDALMTNTIQPALNSVNEARISLNTMMTSATNAISSGLAEIHAANENVNTQITNLLQYLIGESTVNPNASTTVLQRITQAAADAASEATTRLNLLTSAIQSIIDNDTQNRVYDVTVGLSSGQNSIRTYLDILSNNINSLSSAIGDTNSETSLVSQIGALNAAIFGNDSGSGDSDLSLLQKIEAMVGRPLGLQSGEQMVSGTTEYENSIMRYIRRIQGVLGIDGGIAGDESSDLLSDVTSLKTIIYGVTTVNNESVINTDPISHTLRDIVNTFYNSTISIYDRENDTNVSQTNRLDILVNTLSTQISTVIKDNANISSDIEALENTVQDLSPAYIDASSEVIGENNYLVLRRVEGINEAVPDSEEDLEASQLEGELKNTYIKLPQGGGGGVGTYDYLADIIDSPITNTSLKIGDECLLTFVWKVTDKNESNASLSGILQLALNGRNVLTQTIDSNIPQTIDLGQYIASSGRKNFTLSISHTAVPLKSHYYTITAYDAKLTVSLNSEQNFTNELITIPYLATIGSSQIGKTIQVFIDNNLTPVATETIYSETTTSISIPTPSAGAHILKMYFTANITENLQVTSNIYQVGIICRASRQEYITADLQDGFEIKQYDNLSFNYMVGRVVDIAETYNITVSINGHNYPRVAESFTITNFSTPINFLGPITIILTTENSSYTIHGTATTSAYTFELMGSENLFFELNAENRSNLESSEDRIKWDNNVRQNYLEYKAQQQYNKRYTELTSAEAAAIVEPTITFSNFLFSNQYDGWLQDENGKGFLRLRNTDTVTISNLPLFKQKVASDNITVEIEFKTSDVVNANTVFFSQKYLDDTTMQQAAINRELAIRAEMKELNTTDSDYDEERPYKTYTDFSLEELLSVLREKIIISLTPQQMTIYNSFVSRLQYKEEELTTISYVINGISNANKDDSQLIYTYINGVLSNIGKYGSVIGYNSISDLVIGSLECTTDIYAIRIYNTNLTSQQIVNNWIYGLSDLTERTQAYNRNDYTFVNRSDENQNIITTELLEKCAPGTPYLIISANGALTDDSAMPQVKGSNNATTVDLEYRDILNEQNSFLATGVKIQVQGTSSQFYPRKNYKIKMSSFTQNNITHKKKVTASDYVDGNVNGTLKPNIVKTGYKLSENSVPVFDFCLKADYASSEGVNNTGLVALYELLVQNNEAWQTEPQKLQIAGNPTPTDRIRQGVEGYPIVVFYLDTVNNPNGEPVFLGKYNFNNDKGTHDVFGFKTFQKNWYYDTANDPNENNPLLDENKDYLGDESWEGADNFYPLNVFRPYQNGPNSEILANDKWAQAFPARFPGAWEDATDTEKNGANAVNSPVPDRAALQEAIEWVYSTRTEVLKQDIHQNWYDAGIVPNDPDSILPEINETIRNEVAQDRENEYDADIAQLNTLINLVNTTPSEENSLALLNYKIQLIEKYPELLKNYDSNN